MAGCGLITDTSAGRVLGVSCLIWGLVVLLSTQAHTFATAMTVRIFLGMMEAVVTPGLNCKPPSLFSGCRV